MAAGEPAAAAAAAASGGGGSPTATRPPAKGSDTRPIPRVKPPKPKPDDTAEFLAKDVARGLEDLENTLPPPNKTLRPVSETLLSPSAPRRNLDNDTARLRLHGA